MNKLLIIADIAGQYDALIRLQQRFLERDVVLVGDLVDRGPKSREVVEWARSELGVTALKGNHEDLMADACLRLGRYERGVWLENGGVQTLMSYGYEPRTNYPRLGDLEAAYKLVPKEHLTWMQGLPHTFIQEAYGGHPKLFVSHAPWASHLELGEEPSDQRAWMSSLWNRSYPKERPGVFQVFGHNSAWRLQKLGDYAICLDDSWNKKLTGLLWPEQEVVQEPYV